MESSFYQFVTFSYLENSVGSGKSSLLFSLIGEMDYNENRKPEVELNGEVSFVGQQPWILNTTVKDNITLGAP